MLCCVAKEKEKKEKEKIDVEKKTMDTTHLPNVDENMTERDEADAHGEEKRIEIKEDGIGVPHVLVEDVNKSDLDEIYKNPKLPELDEVRPTPNAFQFNLIIIEPWLINKRCSTEWAQVAKVRPYHHQPHSASFPIRHIEQLRPDPNSAITCS
jgi:hypothetical protein